MELLNKLKLYPGRAALASLGAAGLCAYGYYKLGAGEGDFEEAKVLNNFVVFGENARNTATSLEMKGVEKSISDSDEPFYDFASGVLGGAINFYEFLFVDKNTSHNWMVEFGGDLTGFFGSFVGSLKALPGRYLIPMTYGIAMFPEINDFLFEEMGINDFLTEGLEDGLLIGGAYVTGRLIDKIFHTSRFGGGSYTHTKTTGKDWW